MKFKFIAVVGIISFCLYKAALQILPSDDNTPQKTHPNFEHLAHDVRFSIANKVVKLPIVAVNTGVLCKSNGANYSCFVNLEEKQPIIVDELNIGFEGYRRTGYKYTDGDDSYISFPQICPMLSQEWARQICQNELVRSSILDMLQNIQRFSLIKEDNREIFNLGFGGVYESVGTILQKRMSFDNNVPSIYCPVDEQGNPSHLCVAAIRITNNLLAVWTITDHKALDKTAINQQAQIIKAFIQFGIGETENFAALNSALNNIR